MKFFGAGQARTTKDWENYKKRLGLVPFLTSRVTIMRREFLV